MSTHVNVCETYSKQPVVNIRKYWMEQHFYKTDIKKLCWFLGYKIIYRKTRNHK